MLANHPLQSNEWGKFRETWGNKVVFTKHGLITIHKIPFTKYSLGMFIKGPTPTQKMLDDLKTLAKVEKLVFIKLEPNVPVSINYRSSTTNGLKEKLSRLLRDNGAIPGKNLFTPTTFWIDLTKSEEELLKNFHSKTRYNIKVAQKNGVKVTEDNSDKAFNSYLRLTNGTVERQGFYAHNEKYHRLMWKHLYELPTAEGKKPIAHLLTARYKGEIITTWILFAYGDFLYYPYGASTEKYKNVMANNLMMWEAILLGKRLGLKMFDLWGREEGKGFTRFKEGYNPQVIEFLGTWDLVTHPLYHSYRFAEKVRWSLLKARSRFIKPTF